MSDITAEYKASTVELKRRVYLGLREDNLNPLDVVALARDLLDWFPYTDSILTVVERKPADMSPAEMTALARRILDDVGFDPGFDLAPERLETLRAATARTSPRPASRATRASSALMTSLDG
ncbi:hypothetical protein ACFY7H_22135 [Streptomyces sp. NPDC012794]|uniref:hypothetical protein n=1 Tax=Streptomyces sp. NPDC012794 TaxID=3364850 RepID=UPI003691FA4F